MRFLKKLIGRLLDSQIKTIAPLIGLVLKRYIHGNKAGEYFALWQRYGIHVTPVHFYQVVPDTRTLNDALWLEDSPMHGVDLRLEAQVELLTGGLAAYVDEYAQIPHHATAIAQEYYLENPEFGGTDGMVLYGMIRHFKPKRIIEVGSGHSSRLSAKAALRNGDTELTCIEPYASEQLQRGFPGLNRLIQTKVELVPLEVFAQLEANDILFIDSTHVVKCGSDVNYLFLDVIPRLAPGVIVHVHDIFLPSEFPRHWMEERLLFWNEQYLLHAFLLYNSEFEILFMNALMGKRHLAEMQSTFPNANWWGGSSFWMRRKLQPSSPEPSKILRVPTESSVDGLNC